MSKFLPRFMVAIDFGTTFSGFAFAETSEAEVHLTYVYSPSEEYSHPYCKTQTSLLYESKKKKKFKLVSWGRVAEADHSQHLEAPSDKNFHFLSRFKLNLAPKPYKSFLNKNLTRFAESFFKPLPKSMDVERAITDFLHQLGHFSLQELRKKFGSHVQMKDIQWGITVPALWNERAKKIMKKCMIGAGLVERRSEGSNFFFPSSSKSTSSKAEKKGSPFPLQIILEPEAAAMCCFFNESLKIKDGDKMLIVDAGGGTVDLVVQQKIGGTDEFKVRQVSESSGSLCGSTFVDEEFLQYIRKRIKCFDKFENEHPDSMLRLMKEWEDVKCNFSAEGDESTVHLPAKLSNMWENEDLQSNKTPQKDYEALIISKSEMIEIFDPVVQEILRLINEQLEASKECQVLALVGGFSESKYLISRVKEKFQDFVPLIFNPKDAGAAICVGAVQTMLNPKKIISRISKSTYGIDICFLFDPQRDPLSKFFIHKETRIPLCNNRLKIVAKRGEEIDVDKCVAFEVGVAYREQKEGRFCLFSTKKSTPRYVDERGVYKEGEITIPLPDTSKGLDRKVKVNVYFGQTTIKMTLSSENFGEETEVEMELVEFDWSKDEETGCDEEEGPSRGEDRDPSKRNDAEVQNILRHILLHQFFN